MKETYIIKIKVNTKTDKVISVSQTGCPWKPLEGKKHMIKALKDAVTTLEEE